MNNKLKCILLIDDDDDDNFFHEREIRKINKTSLVISKDTGKKALEYLQSKQDTHPNLIFLDINMPGMNGWDFLNEYSKLDKSLQSKVVIIMLTTSGDPEDRARARSWSFVSGYITKPLTKEIMVEIIHKFFE